jgi:catechol 2,3-dioxygenase-like lactoylglutathione lyase family enzyme
MLACADVGRSLAFYTGLGLEVIVTDSDRGEGGALRYARLRAPEGEGTLSLERAEAPGAGRAALYLECADLDQRVRALSAAGYAFASHPETKPWLWREAELRDPDGNVVCLYHAGSYRLDPPWRLPGTQGAAVAERAAAAAAPEAFLAARNRGYVEAQIPSARDDEIAAWLEALIAGGEAARDAAATALGPAYTATMLAFAERAASRAVRARAARPALLGLVAVGLVWREAADVRPAVPVLGVLHDAAARAGDDPARVFSDAAALLPADTAPVLRDFLTRPDLDGILAEMGYAAGADGAGFRYRRLWGGGEVRDDSGFTDPGA